MKRFLILLLLMFSFSISYGDNEKRISKDDLPSTSIKFIERYYNGLTIDYCLSEKVFSRIVEYDVYLSDGTKIEFDKHGCLISIISPNRCGVNFCILPTKIRSYLIINYYDCHIYGYSIEHKRKSYEEHTVYLSNGHKLVFNSKGSLIEIDR